MREAEGMHEGHSLKELSGECLHLVDGVSIVVVALDDIVERGTKGLKHHAVILMMIEGLVKPDDTAAALRIGFIESLHDVPLSLRRVHVFLDRFDNLHTAELTFTANSSYLHLASTTLPKVPVPSSRVTLYLCPNFSPILNLKCGVVLRFRVEEDMELLTSD